MGELGLLPSGRITYYASKLSNENQEEEKFDELFKRSMGEGLFALAALKNSSGLSSTFRYWRNFASRYLSDRCLMTEVTPNQPNPISPLEDSEIQSLLISVPPMRGAEYVSAANLQMSRLELDKWVCEQIRIIGSLAVLFTKRAPQWHQVGRVCFHLAESKSDPDYPFAFMATYAPTLSEYGKTRHQPLSHALEEYTGEKNRNLLFRLLSPIQLASESSSLVKDLIETGDIYHPLAWTAQEAYEFLKEAPLYENSGLVVRMPNWWRKRRRPRIGVTIGGNKKGNFDTDSLLEFELNFSLGDEKLTEAELKDLMSASNGLVFFKGQWVEVDKEKLTEALEHWKTVEKEAANGGISFVDGMRLLAGAPVDLAENDLPEDSYSWSFVKPGKWLETTLAELHSPSQTKGTKPGKALKATLRPYQQDGVSWLWLLSQLKLGACLADDMGLGKTIQVISLLLLLKKKSNSAPSLLLLPASLMGNWKSEIENFAPSLHCIFLHSSQMSKKEIIKISEKKGSLKKYDLVLATYGTLRRQEWLQTRSWQLLILDEAQAIKNPAAQQTKKVKTLNAVSRIAMTGTPIENRISDLWSLFDFLNPGLLGSASKFKGFVKSLSEREHDQYAPLRNLVRPYILRRLKTDRSIINDLPEKIEMIAYCSLSKSQAIQYQKAVTKLKNDLEVAQGIQRRGLVLASLMRFKQICNHPSQLLGDGEYDPKKSGKFQRLASLCQEIASRQEKLLIFTQFREMTEPLASYLAEVFGRPGLVLHGGTPIKQRQKLVNRFQEETGPPFFVLSLKAGGSGLNLTRASHVIHFDRWWNPAVENQATDRAFRIGQKKNVIVHKFVCAGTLEEKIDRLIEEKKSLSEDLLSGGAEALLTEMDNETLINLISLDIEKTQV